MTKDKMKVLYLVNVPSPYRIDFFNELGRKCELTVLFERYTSAERKVDWHKNNFTNFTGVFLKGRNVGSDKSFCFEVIKYLKSPLYDVVVIGGYATPTGMLAIETLKAIKKPFILNADGGLISNDSKWKIGLKKHFISSATYWLSSGKSTTNYLLNYGAKPEKTFFYPFTSLSRKEVLNEPRTKSEKSEMKEKLGILEEKVVLSVGRFIPGKGFDILIKAAAEVPGEIGFYIIGGEPTLEYMELKDEMDLRNVHFIGFKSKEEIKKFYQSSDIFVLPTRKDVWGLVINEAMSFGLPVVTTDQCVAGLELIEDDENGFIVPADEPESLAEAINILLEDESLMKKLSINNLEKMKNYTIEEMAIRHIEVFADFSHEAKTKELQIT